MRQEAAHHPAGWGLRATCCCRAVLMCAQKSGATGGVATPEIDSRANCTHDIPNFSIVQSLLPSACLGPVWPVAHQEGEKLGLEWWVLSQRG